MLNLRRFSVPYLESEKKRLQEEQMSQHELRSKSYSQLNFGELDTLTTTDNQLAEIEIELQSRYKQIEEEKQKEKAMNGPPLKPQRN